MNLIKLRGLKKLKNPLCFIRTNRDKHSHGHKSVQSTSQQQNPAPNRAHTRRNRRFSVVFPPNPPDSPTPIHNCSRHIHTSLNTHTLTRIYANCRDDMERTITREMREILRERFKEERDVIREISDERERESFPRFPENRVIY